MSNINWIKIIQNDKSYYPQVLLEECKYIVKERKVKIYINDDLEISSDGSDE